LVDKKIEQRMNVAEIRMLKWMRSIGVASIMDRMRGNRLRWVGHVMRRENSNVLKTVMEMNIEGRRGTGILKKEWLYANQCDRRTADMCVVVGDRFK